MTGSDQSVLTIFFKHYVLSITDDKILTGNDHKLTMNLISGLVQVPIAEQKPLNNISDSNKGHNATGVIINIKGTETDF